MLVAPELAEEIERVLAAVPPRGLTPAQRAAVDRYGDEFARRRLLPRLAELIGAPIEAVRYYRSRHREATREVRA